MSGFVPQDLAGIRKRCRPIFWHFLISLASHDSLSFPHSTSASDHSNHGQLGMALAFPPPFFSVQSYGLYTI